MGQESEKGVGVKFGRTQADVSFPHFVSWLEFSGDSWQRVGTVGMG